MGRALTCVTRLNAFCVVRVQLKPSSLKPTSSFFDLGGSSLDLVALLSKVKKHCGASISIREFHDAPTAGKFAALVSDRAAASASGLTGDAGASSRRGDAGRVRPPLPRPDLLPLSFSQEHLWIFEQMAPGRAAYHVPVAFYVPKSFDVPATEWGCVPVHRVRSCGMRVR